MQSNILDAKPDADIRVYAIFFEIVAGDDGAKYEVEPSDLLDDPRVSVYWDDRRVTGRWFEDNVTRVGARAGEEGRIEWDAFILYDDRVEWADEPPRIVSWGRPVIQEKNRLLRDLETSLGHLPR